jgi:hypothetical protein
MAASSLCRVSLGLSTRLLNSVGLTVFDREGLNSSTLNGGSGVNHWPPFAFLIDLTGADNV